MNNPLPNKIKIDIAFDVSTSKTGYAVLLNGKPFTFKTGSLSVGEIEMIKKENYVGHTSFNDHTKIEKQRPIDYGNYGDKMFHGSFDSIQMIASIIYQSLKPINEIIQNAKLTKETKGEIIEAPEIEEFNIVFEISEIPNFGKFSNHQTITSVRKLALYVGAMLQATSNVIHNAAFHFASKAVVKLIKPTEWQQRTFDKQGDRDKTKAMSVYCANKHLIRWGLTPITIDNDDMADAINIAIVANEVRDNVFAAAEATKRKQDINLTHNREIAKLESLINNLKAKALNAKNNFIDNVLWASTTSYNDLTTPADKKRHSKYVKYTLEDVRVQDITDFLSSSQKKQYLEWSEKIDDHKEKLAALRVEKVIKVSNGKA